MSEQTDEKPKPKKTRRAHGAGSVYQRSDGRWAGQADLGWIGGKRVRKYVYADTEREAQSKLNRILADHQRGVPIASDRQTVSQFLKQWLAGAESRLKPSTIDNYRILIQTHIEPAVGNIALSRLNAQHVQGMVSGILKNGKSTRTAQYCRAILRAALADAERWGMIPRNVAALTSSPTVKTKERHALTLDQVHALLQAARNHGDETLYAVAAGIGLRRGEIFGLRWRDVDLDRGLLRVRTQIQWKGASWSFTDLKTTGSQRTIPLSPGLVTALRSHRRTQIEQRLQAGDRWTDHDLVFCGKLGLPRTYWRITGDLDTLLAEAGIPRVTFHELRHTAGSLMLEQGVHPKIISEMLGHSSIKITMDVYGHVSTDALRQATGLVDRFFDQEDVG